MGQRGAGELPRGDFRLQAGLNIGEIGGVPPDAAKSLAAFRNRVLPQSALERARGVIEGQAKVRERGRGGRRGTGINRRHRRCGSARIHLTTVTSVLVMETVCDARHFRPLLLCRVARRPAQVVHSGGLLRDVKNYLASWRLSADTGANAREKQGDRRTKP